MWWKEFLYFQRGSKVAVILLLILIMLTLIFNAFIININSSEIVLQHNDSIINEFEAISIQRRTNTQSGNYANSQKNLDYKDSTYNASTRSTVENQKGYTNTNYIRVEKLSPGEKISLNTSDTTEWKKIPGIGSSYSSRIVNYRALLGGYAHKEQLLEVYGIDAEMYSRISSYIEEDSSYSKIDINNLEFRNLLRHPYLNYSQVLVIVNLRDKKGDITSINELAMFEEFTSNDISRLQHYLGF